MIKMMKNVFSIMSYFLLQRGICRNERTEEESDMILMMYIMGI